MALTELVVSALSGRLYSQSQIQHSSIREQTTAGGVSATTKSSHAEVKLFSNKTKYFLFLLLIKSMQDQSSLLSRDIQLACLDVIRYTTDAG